MGRSDKTQMEPRYRHARPLAVKDRDKCSEGGISQGRDELDAPSKNHSEVPYGNLQQLSSNILFFLLSPTTPCFADAGCPAPLTEIFQPSLASQTIMAPQANQVCVAYVEYIFASSTATVLTVVAVVQIGK
jgi:hypothetical protein